MWPIIAEPGLRCTEYRHIIHPDRLCLSELPEKTLAGVSRSSFKNYCIDCPNAGGTVNMPAMSDTSIPVETSAKRPVVCPAPDAASRAERMEKPALKMSSSI